MGGMGKMTQLVAQKIARKTAPVCTGVKKPTRGGKGGKIGKSIRPRSQSASSSSSSSDS